MNIPKLNWTNDKMIKIYRISFIVLLTGFLVSIGFGLIMIALLLGVSSILTYILLLFEVQEDYFNRQIDLIIKFKENKPLTLEELKKIEMEEDKKTEDKENGTNIIEQPEDKIVNDVKPS